MAIPKIKYLNNKDLLKEIHLSKCSFSSFLSETDSEYDIIVKSINDINDEIIEQAKQNRIKRIYKETKDKVSIDSISDDDLVYRIMTFDHIPLAPGRKKTPKSEADKHIKVNFPPFQHFRKIDNEYQCVGKSHWEGGIQNGNFSLTHGSFTRNLSVMVMMLVDKYGTKGNWRGYSYNDEMKSQALLQLTQIGLQFDESKGNNPFAYYTKILSNSFVRVLNTERRNQSIRDDLLEMNGMNPSYTRQSNWQSHDN